MSRKRYVPISHNEVIDYVMMHHYAGATSQAFDLHVVQEAKEDLNKFLYSKTAPRLYMHFISTQ